MEYEIERCEPWPMHSVIVGAGVPLEERWWYSIRRFIECVPSGALIDA
jgi:hypothetical protein